MIILTNDQLYSFRDGESIFLSILPWFLLSVFLIRNLYMTLLIPPWHAHFYFFSQGSMSVTFCKWGANYKLSHRYRTALTSPFITKQKVWEEYFSRDFDSTLYSFFSNPWNNLYITKRIILDIFLISGPLVHLYHTIRKWLVECTYDLCLYFGKGSYYTALP